MLALTNADTPLKPATGSETPVGDVDLSSGFEGITPQHKAMQTPNEVLGTPFRTPGRPGEADVAWGGGEGRGGVHVYTLYRWSCITGVFIAWWSLMEGGCAQLWRTLMCKWPNPY